MSVACAPAASPMSIEEEDSSSEDYFEEEVSVPKDLKERMENIMSICFPRNAKAEQSLCFFACFEVEGSFVFYSNLEACEYVSPCFVAAACLLQHHCGKIPPDSDLMMWKDCCLSTVGRASMFYTDFSNERLGQLKEQLDDLNQDCFDDFVFVTEIHYPNASDRIVKGQCKTGRFPMIGLVYYILTHLMCTTREDISEDHILDKEMVHADMKLCDLPDDCLMIEKFEHIFDYVDLGI